MILCAQKHHDRLYFSGRGKGKVGSIRAYYLPGTPSFIGFQCEDTLIPYLKNVRGLRDHLQRVFPNQRARAGMCDNSRRIYSCSRKALEYGFHFRDDTFSYFVKVNENGEFNIFAYRESEVADG